MVKSVEKFRHYAVFTKDDDSNRISCRTMIGSEIGSVFTGRAVDIVPFPARFRWLDKLETTYFMDIVRDLNIDGMLLRTYQKGSKNRKKRLSAKS